MTTHADRVARGRAARRKGHDAERDLAGYLRRWWPDAERKPDNGWRTGGRTSADHGDIRGTGPIVWQVKHCKDFRPEQFMLEAFEQATAAGADYGILVERRDRVSDPGRWWAWLSVSDVAGLLGGLGVVPRNIRPGVLTAPVRTELRHVVALLVAAGYAEQTLSGSERPNTPDPSDPPREA